jgi:hypothetical protein
MDEQKRTAVQITHHDGRYWFLAVMICTFYKYSKRGSVDQVNFIRIEEAEAKSTIEQLKMKKYLTSGGIEFFGDQAILLVEKRNNASNQKFKVKEVPNG